MTIERNDAQYWTSGSALDWELRELDEEIAFWAELEEDSFEFWGTHSIRPTELPIAAA